MVGLAFAIALRKFAPDVAFTIYDGATELSEVGAGITVQRRAWQILCAIGLEEELLKLIGSREQKCTQIRVFGASGTHVLTGPLSAVAYIYRKSDQPEGVHLKTIQTSGTLLHNHSTQRPLSLLTKHGLPEPGYTFHRGELQKVMIQHLTSSHAVHTRKRLISYTTLKGSVELHFQDGSTAQCDILVGADGVRSAVRGAMYTKLANAAVAAGDEEGAKALKEHISPVFSGTVIYRTLIRKDTLPEEAAQNPAFNKTEAMIVRSHFLFLMAAAESLSCTLVRREEQGMSSHSRFL